MNATATQVLVLVDSLQRCSGVIDKAVRLQRATGARLHVVHVGYERFFEAGSDLSSEDADGMVDEHRQALLRELDAALADARAGAQAAGARIDSEVLWNRMRTRPGWPQDQRRPST